MNSPGVMIVMSSSGFEQLLAESQAGRLAAWTRLYRLRRPVIDRNPGGPNCMTCLGAADELVVNGRQTVKNNDISRLKEWHFDFRMHSHTVIYSTSDATMSERGPSISPLFQFV